MEEKNMELSGRDAEKLDNINDFEQYKVPI